MTAEEALAALQQVMHPEINRSLPDLRMIRDLSVDDGHISFALVLPFKESSIKDKLLHRVRQAIADRDPAAVVEIKLTEMSQRERASFLAAADGDTKLAQAGNRIAHTVAVLSGKGGVGKSSVTALLAVALRRRGARVGVLDADITGPSIPMMFGLHQAPRSGPVGILPVSTATGIKVMSINLLLPDKDQAVVWRGPLISSAIKQFWGDVAWGALDYLIVDLPPGTSDASLTVMQSIPLSGILLVTSPQDLAGMVVRKAARMAQQMKAPILGLVENMSSIACPKCGEQIDVFGPGRARLTAAQLGLPLLGRLPLEPELAVRCDAGEIEDFKADSFESTAEKVIEQIAAFKNAPAV